MEMLISAAVGELVSRAMSFMVGRCRSTPATAEENLRRLHRLLLRIRTVVEEAEQRHVTNQAMLLQLKILRDEMLKGSYFLDEFRYQETQHEDEVSHPFALSEFNSAKRLKFPAISSNSKWVSFSSSRKAEDLQRMVRSLEIIIADTNEFVIFLMQYPPIYRRPYSAHLFLEKCMFGRHMEREQIVGFLLQSEHLGCEKIGVLPIVGPKSIGKSTLVEHVCIDERVRDHFSLILVHTGNGLIKDGKVDKESCVVKHQNHASHKRMLLIIELSEQMDDETLRGLHFSSEIRMANGSKIIITSRHDNIRKLGTTQAIRLRPLSCEAYWYFFKVRLFGSADPEEHTRLASIAMDIANEMKGSFMYANVFCDLLRTSFSVRFWRSVLTWIREYMQINAFLFGEYPDDVRMENRPACAWRLTKPSKKFMVYKPIEKDRREDEVPKITIQDLLRGKANARGDSEILIWKSQVPPYCNFVAKMCGSDEHQES